MTPTPPSTCRVRVNLTQPRFSRAWFLLALLTVASGMRSPSAELAFPANGNGARPMSFIGLTNLHGFTRFTSSNEIIFISPVLASPIAWDEAILSWNIKTATNCGYTFELRPVWPGEAGRFFNLGYWTAFPGTHPRESVNGQKDSTGRVDTDTLLLNKPCSNHQVRITISSATKTNLDALIDFLGLSLLNRRAFPGLSTNLVNSPEVLLPVPQRSQLAYSAGRDWCSPTSVSMVLAYWAERLKQPELALGVPEVAAGVHDPKWPGTGNWPFNTAFAGMQPGLRACVRHLSGLSELQLLLKAGVAPIVSVSFDLLSGKEKDEGTGHLVVCVGLTSSGDFILNDPWARLEKGERVQRVVSAPRLSRAWSRSRGVVYLIHPAGWPMPSSLRPN